MMTIVISFIALIAVLVIIHMLLIHSGTQIGEKGRKNMLLQDILYIAESVLLFAFSLVWWMLSEPDSKLYALVIAAIGILLLIGGAVGLRGILRESSEDLVTENLTEIRIVPAGYHNQARRLEGMVNGKNSWFMMRGADKALAEKIKKSGRRQVTVVYHPSNRRIESILGL